MTTNHQSLLPMAGHSQFKNIMFRKGAQDAKKAKLFTKIQREIITACKSGAPDPATNPSLRAAITKARQENMPKDKIEATIKRASGAGNTEQYDAIRYEGYGPGGVALMVEALTDNRNRTASEVRTLFTKYHGHLGETGSVAFLFDHAGLITYPKSAAHDDAMLEAAIEAGAENCESAQNEHSVTSKIETFGQVRDALEKKLGAPASAKLTWIPKTTTPVNEEQASNLLKLIEALEDNDDVQEVYANFEMDSAMLEKLSA